MALTLVNHFDSWYIFLVNEGLFEAVLKQGNEHMCIKCSAPHWEYLCLKLSWKRSYTETFEAGERGWGIIAVVAVPQQFGFILLVTHETNCSWERRILSKLIIYIFFDCGAAWLRGFWIILLWGTYLKSTSGQVALLWVRWKKERLF